MMAATRAGVRCRIAHLELDPAGYAELIASPYADELLAGDPPVGLVLVRGDPESGALPAPGGSPVVVAWVGATTGGAGPETADLVVGPGEVGRLIETVTANPLAATALATMLRAIPRLPVDEALVLESATYSMLQAGPEFAAWRAGSPAEPDRTPGPTVLVERAGGVLTVTLNRPHRHNAISTAVRDELSEALALARVDRSITSVELTGAGPSFSSGGDLGEFGERPDPATAHRTRLARNPGRLVHQLGNVTARIHGTAFGGGIEIAAFARMVVAAPGTRIALPEVGLGLIPGAGGTVSVTRRIGRQRTAALALARLELDVATAHAWGLVDALADTVA